MMWPPLFMVLLAGVAIADGEFLEGLGLIAAGMCWTLGRVWRAQEKERW